MKTSALLLLGFFLVLGAQRAHADVIAPKGPVPVIMVELVNPADFPGFNFYIREGFGSEKMYLEAGKQVKTGGFRWHGYALFAEDKQGNQFESKDWIYSSDLERSKRVDYHYVEQIKVLAVGNGEVKFEAKWIKVDKNGSMRMDKNGKTKVVKGEVEMNWLVMVVPVVCLLGLVAFLLLRGKQP
jgi:hypothetical protein